MVAAAGAGRTVAPSLATNSIAAGPTRRRPSPSVSRSSYLSLNSATATAVYAIREGDGPGPLGVEGKNGEGEPRVSFPWCVMGCFGSQSSKQSQDESKNQKRRSDAITRQLQKDKQVYRATHRLLLLGECICLASPRLASSRLASPRLVSSPFSTRECSSAARTKETRVDPKLFREPRISTKQFCRGPISITGRALAIRFDRCDARGN